LNDLVAFATAKGRAGPVRAEPVLAAVRAAWGLVVAGRAGHRRQSGSSSMP